LIRSYHNKQTHSVVLYCLVVSQSIPFKPEIIRFPDLQRLGHVIQHKSTAVVGGLINDLSLDSHDLAQEMFSSFVLYLTKPAFYSCRTPVNDNVYNCISSSLWLLTQHPPSCVYSFTRFWRHCVIAWTTSTI